MWTSHRGSKQALPAWLTPVLADSNIDSNIWRREVGWCRKLKDSSFGLTRAAIKGFEVGYGRQF